MKSWIMQDFIFFYRKKLIFYLFLQFLDRKYIIQMKQLFHHFTM